MEMRTIWLPSCFHGIERKPLQSMVTFYIIQTKEAFIKQIAFLRELSTSHLEKEEPAHQEGR